MTNDHKQWEQLYREALLETDLGILPQKIDQARSAIQQRRYRLADNHAHRDELQAMEDALSNLRAISPRPRSGAS